MTRGGGGVETFMSRNKILLRDAETTVGAFDVEWSILKVQSMDFQVVDSETDWKTMACEDIKQHKQNNHRNYLKND